MPTATYNTAICHDEAEFNTVTAKVTELAEKHGVSKDIKWGHYDVWNDYNKIILADLEELVFEGQTNKWEDLYVGVVFPEGKPALRTIPTPLPHYSVHYDETKHMEIIYDDMADMTYDLDTNWGRFAADVLAYLCETVPQDDLPAL